VLLQRIIAHIQKPTEHIKITGTITNDKNSYILNTIQEISLKKNIVNKYVLALLHSNLVNWYVYRFIFAKAIRTFQFSGDVIKKLPIPKIPKEQQEPFVKLVDIIIESKETIQDYKILLNEAIQNDNFKRELKLKKEIEKLEDLVQNSIDKIDEMVYKLYGLSSEEIKIVEKID
jgi:hypothetical protein